MSAQKVKSAWEDLPALARQGAVAAGFILTLVGGVALGGESSTQTPGETQEQLARRVDRNTARIDTVVIEQRAAQKRDVEQTNYLVYLKCLSDKSKSECQSEFVERQLVSTP